jgi:hypothetical protein
MCGVPFLPLLYFSTFPNSSTIHILSLTDTWSRGCNAVVEHILSTSKVLDSIPSTKHTEWFWKYSRITSYLSFCFYFFNFTFYCFITIKLRLKKRINFPSRNVSQKQQFFSTSLCPAMLQSSSRWFVPSVLAAHLQGQETQRLWCTQIRQRSQSLNR